MEHLMHGEFGMVGRSRVKEPVARAIGFDIEGHAADRSPLTVVRRDKGEPMLPRVQVGIPVRHRDLVVVQNDRLPVICGRLHDIPHLVQIGVIGGRERVTWCSFHQHDV